MNWRNMYLQQKIRVALSWAALILAFSFVALCALPPSIILVYTIASLAALATGSK